ncbi:unnamed protein product [Ectocarpus sp. 12 AP-2014]
MNIVMNITIIAEHDERCRYFAHEKHGNHSVPRDCSELGFSPQLLLGDIIYKSSTNPPQFFVSWGPLSMLATIHWSISFDLGRAGRANPKALPQQLESFVQYVSRFRAALTS